MCPVPDPSIKRVTRPGTRPRWAVHAAPVISAAFVKLGLLCRTGFLILRKKSRWKTA